MDLSAKGATRAAIRGRGVANAQGWIVQVVDVARGAAMLKKGGRVESSDQAVAIIVGGGGGGMLIVTVASRIEAPV
jgi:hypothetical protein